MARLLRLASLHAHSCLPRPAVKIRHEAIAHGSSSRKLHEGHERALRRLDAPQSTAVESSDLMDDATEDTLEMLPLGTHGRASPLR